MKRTDLLRLNHMIKVIKDLPQVPDYPNMFTGDNVNYQLIEYHNLCSELYTWLLNYAKPHYVQVEDRLHDIRDQYYILRVVNYNPEASCTKQEDNGSVTYTQPINGTYDIIEEVLLYHSDDKKFAEANKEILKETE